MKIRGLVIAVLVFGGLSGVLYWSGHRKASPESKVSADTPPAILKLDQSSISQLEIKKKDATPILLRKAGSGSWEISQPKPLAADQDTVSGVLSTLASLNSQRLVEDKATDLKPFGLTQPALEIDLTGKDNKSQKLLLGDDTPTSGGVYAALAGDPRVFTVFSYSKTALDKSLNDLRDKRLLNITADKISRIELLRKNQDVEFGRDQDEWQILKPKPLRADSSLVGDLAQKLSDARMDLSGTEDAASAFAHAPVLATAKVTGPSGTEELQLRKAKDTFYAKSSIVDGVYKVSADLGQSLDKGVDDFRNKKLFDFGYNDPNKIEMHHGAKAYFLTRNAQDWWSNGKKMDAESVLSLVSQLRDLAATKFPESGFTNSNLELTVTSNDGKHVEKVSIAKSGNNYIAKRENEPALYELDASAIEGLQKAADAIKPEAPPKK
jgi:hypothetical protein